MLNFRMVKGLRPHSDLSVVHPDMLADGWTFATDFPGAIGDGLHRLPFLRDLQTPASPQMSGRVTVPVLWDKVRGTIVSNESAEIIRLFNAAFDGLPGNRNDYWPEPLRADIEEANAPVYDGGEQRRLSGGFRFLASGL